MCERTVIAAAVCWNRGRTAWLGVLVGLGALLGGCGKGDIARLPLHGTISLPSGEALTGSITFVPLEGTPGPGATATISEGRYQFDRENGPTAGPHRVTVMRAIPKRLLLESRHSKVPPAAKPAAPTAEPRMQWTLSADVADDGEYQRDFTLEP
jgi:hypothetical protein